MTLLESVHNYSLITQVDFGFSWFKTARAWAFTSFAALAWKSKTNKPEKKGTWCMFETAFDNFKKDIVTQSYM
jgi:hypothetical protein